MASFSCVGNCNQAGETRILNTEYLIQKAVVSFQGVPGTTRVYEIFAHATCSVGEPFIFYNSTCDNCGIIPDPMRYANIPELDMARVKLESSKKFF